MKGHGVLRVSVLTFVVLLSGLPVWAHHILGIPHYSYDEDYPQTPVLTYRVNAGPHEVKMTGYPGRPRVGERCTLSVYIRRTADNTLFKRPVELTVFRDDLIGEDPVIYGPVKAELTENVFKFAPTFPDEANYLTRIYFEADGEPWTLDLPMVAGEPGSPWTVLVSVLGGLLVFFVVVRAIHIKRERLKAKGRAVEEA